MSRASRRRQQGVYLLAKWFVLGGVVLLAWLAIGFVVGTAVGR